MNSLLFFFQLILKLSSFATMLPMNNDNMNRETILPYPSHISLFYPATINNKAMEQSSDGSRIEFQIRNHQGPGTYIFGFDTGHGKNRHYRVEERFRNGSVKGRYGFYDANGKLKIIDYVGGLIGDYQDRHHENIKHET